MKFTLLSPLMLFCAALTWMALSEAALASTGQSMDSRILGEWQIVDANGEIKYMAIFQNRLNQLRMVECNSGYDRQGNEIGVVVCPNSITSGLILKPFRDNQFKIATAGHPFTNIEVSDSELKISGLFGYFTEAWAKADQNLLFVYGGK